MSKAKKVLTAACILFAAAGVTACGAKNAEESNAGEGRTAVSAAAAESSAADAVSEKENAAAETETASYEDILKHCTEILSSEDPWELEMEGDDPFTGLFEVAGGTDTEEALRSVGYAVRDLNSDGTDELIIGSVYDDELDGGSFANPIYDIFTADGAETKLLFKGWSRNRCYGMQDGAFLNEGSSGASSSFLGKFVMENTAPAAVVWDFCYFTEYDDSDGKVYVYKNQNGSWDRDSSEQQDLTEEEFADLVSEYEQQLIHSDLESLESYTMPITVCTLEEYGKDANTCTWVSLDSDYEYQSHLVLLTETDVTDVKICRLSFTDVDEDGDPVYDSELLYEQDRLTADLPLGVDLTFAGDMSCYGISCTDADGNRHSYILGQSGMDGSYYLTAR